MPREITDRNLVIAAVKNLALTAELFEDQGKKKTGNDLEVIVQGRDYGNGKRVGPYVKLLTFDAEEVIMRQGEWGGNTFYIAVEGTLDVYVRDGVGQKKISELSPGTCFGEMGLLAGVERNATIKVPADSSAVVLEITRPALRLLRKLNKFGQILDETYRKHGFGRLLEDLKPRLNDELIERLRQTGQYLVYGKNHVFCKEGDAIDRLVLVRNGWVRRSRGVRFDADTPEVVMGVGATIGVDFLGEGNCLGLESLTADSTWPYTASAMARTEVLEVPLATLELDHDLRAHLLEVFEAFSAADNTAPQTVESVPDLNALKSTEQEIATGIIDGANVLVMDMDLCVRCGNCSLACHKMHGQSRLLRRGIQIERPTKIGQKRLQHALVPQVCLHCKDPECLTGCPTGSIFRHSIGHVDIDPHTCIGCFDCATQCPYDAISMVPKDVVTPAVSTFSRLKRFLSFKTAPAIALEPGDDVVAVKCNLCEDTPLNPAGVKTKAYSCEENCPTGALVRVDPTEYFSEITSTLGLVFQDSTHAFGRNIHKSDPLAKTWNVGGIVFSVLIAAITILGLAKYGFDEPLTGNWLTMRWLTGIVGLGGVATVMTYPLRKQVYRRRAGALRYWMLAHVYLGVIAGIVLLLHSGIRTGGWLTTLLYVAFDFVILSGIVGLLSYWLAPRVMTRIEGEPLLIEDLEVRRAELLSESKAIVEKSAGWLKDEISQRVYPKYLNRKFLWKQLRVREELKTQLAEAREEFKDRTTRLATEDERELLLSAVETAVTIRRLDTLIFLHRVLRFWIAPHVISTALMLALMVVHVIQVVYFRTVN